VIDAGGGRAARIVAAAVGIDRGARLPGRHRHARDAAGSVRKPRRLVAVRARGRADPGRARHGAARDQADPAVGRADRAGLRPARRFHPGPLGPRRAAARQLPRHAHHRRGRPVGRAHRHLGHDRGALPDPRRAGRRGRRRRGVHGAVEAARRPLSRRLGEGRGRRVGALRHDLRLGLGQRRIDRHDHDPEHDPHGLSPPLRRRGRGGGVVGRPDHAAGHGRRRLPDGRDAARHLRGRHGRGGAAGGAVLRRRLGRLPRLRAPVRAPGPAGERASRLGACRADGAVLPRAVRRAGDAADHHGHDAAIRLPARDRRRARICWSSTTAAASTCDASRKGWRRP
jgi:hypothetical protein